ncbi:MAG: 2-polyprenyl-3-methyl-6-methoxy-1,4-benzoquinone monooxygenase [Gammaproteobacteria bacterium]
MIVKKLSVLDCVLVGLENALSVSSFSKPNFNFKFNLPVPDLSVADCKRSARLLRVNHAGEVCAQALYLGQACATSDPVLRSEFIRAAGEEKEHLRDCAQRLKELKASPSLLNPIWGLGSLALGYTLGRFGKGLSLGFMAETERQVMRHIEDHLEQLPMADGVSRDLLEQMHRDESEHAHWAQEQGGADLPILIKRLMQSMAAVFRTITKYI